MIHRVNQIHSVVLASGLVIATTVSVIFRTSIDHLPAMVQPGLMLCKQLSDTHPSLHFGIEAPDYYIDCNPNSSSPLGAIVRFQTAQALQNWLAANPQ